MANPRHPTWQPKYLPGLFGLEIAWDPQYINKGWPDAYRLRLTRLPSFYGIWPGLSLVVSACLLSRSTIGTPLPSLKPRVSDPFPSCLIGIEPTYRTQCAEPNRRGFVANILRTPDRPGQALNPTMTMEPLGIPTHWFVIYICISHFFSIYIVS